MARGEHCGLPAMPTSVHAPKCEPVEPLARLQYAVTQPADHLLAQYAQRVDSTDHVQARYAQHAEPADHVLALYAQHADSARALASRLLYDRCEAEDVVQDVFLTLWRRPERFDADRGTGRAWLLTVVRNRSMDHLRRRSVRPREDMADFFERLPDPHPRDVLEELEVGARDAALWRLVDSLPPTQASLIRRAFVDGHTHQEIADELGLPLGTVKGRIRLGLEKLRNAVTSGALDAAR
jgi:RNA polymerase sigma-70 factor, ECF subfamily